jgi:hypothetical protein
VRTTIEESFQQENFTVRLTITEKEEPILGLRQEDGGVRRERTEHFLVENFRGQGDHRYMSFGSLAEVDEMIDVLYQAKAWLAERKKRDEP